MMVVKRIYYRNDPIILGVPPLKPPNHYVAIPLGAANLWDQLEKAGVPDVKGVWGFIYGAQPGPFTVIAIKQRYTGHSKQAALVLTRRPPTWTFRRANIRGGHPNCKPRRK